MNPRLKDGQHLILFRYRDENKSLDSKSLKALCKLTRLLDEHDIVYEKIVGDYEPTDDEDYHERIIQIWMDAENYTIYQLIRD